MAQFAPALPSGQELAMTLTFVRILGPLVIAHGLSHAVLPMRGSLAPLAYGDWIPIALYGIAMAGFVAAGLGLLGLKPFMHFVSPLLVLSSAYSLIALFALGDPALWVGAASDVALLFLGLWRAFAGWPAHPSHHPWLHVAGVASGVALVVYVGAAAFTYPVFRYWGSTPDELTMSLPGDGERRDAALEMQHAITIDAPPEDVWVWLVQVGQDRAGFYSYDWLERAAGLGIRNVREVRPEWQTLQAGDVIRATPPNYLGGIANVMWTVSDVAPERALVLDGRGAFVLRPLANERTRLIVRSKMSDRNRSVWRSAVNLLGFQLPHFIMERQMLVSIKALAEERRAARDAEDPVRTIDILATDDMKYSVTEIAAEPGEQIRIRLVSKGVIPKVAMAHNVVFLKLDTDIDTLLKEGGPYRENDFIPPSMSGQVIAKTALAGPGERVQVTFTVPTTPGEYPFICTFAGHYQAGMKGTLIVGSQRMTRAIPTVAPSL
jgi:azurin